MVSWIVHHKKYDVDENVKVYLVEPFALIRLVKSFLKWIGKARHKSQNTEE